MTTMLQNVSIETPEMDDARWQAVCARDASQNGRFVYAVKTTGVYCRPSCASRRPKRDNVAFFAVPELAERAGYRPCKRCRPKDARAAETVERMREACRFIDGYDDGVPSLDEIAAEVGMSPHHFQRSFKKIVGLTPRQYAEGRRVARMKALLREGDEVAGALYEVGYGSSSRLYEKAAAHFGMTPASYRKGGAGATIRYAFAATPLGLLNVAATDTGICFVSLGDSEEELLTELRTEFPEAAVVPDDGSMSDWLETVGRALEGRTPAEALPLDIRATAFQWQVWRALTEIPKGETRTYSEIAAALGKPNAQRAVGRACATNPVSVVIPCHRAVREDGGLGGYRWGLDRKERLLAVERGE